MSDYPTSINLCDGKYTIIYDFATGQSECLRYGQPWRQLVGDKMVLACFDEIVRLRAELAACQEKVQELSRIEEMREANPLHTDTETLVQRFAEAMRNKLAKAERKYGYSNLWLDNGWMDECREKLVEHLHKGDPLDVANYCAFLWHHGEHCRPESKGNGQVECLKEFEKFLASGNTSLADCWNTRGVLAERELASERSRILELEATLRLTDNVYVKLLESNLTAEREKVKTLESIQASDWEALRHQSESLESAYQQLASAQATIAEIAGCFEAAYAEGLTEAIVETQDERVRDLFARRLEYAYIATQATNHDALHEALARECERLADVAGDEPEHVKAMFSEWLREEAAAHRAEKIVSEWPEWKRDYRVAPVAEKVRYGSLVFLDGYHDLPDGTKLYAAPVVQPDMIRPDQEALQQIIAAALYDFGGFITTRQKQLVASATDNAADTVEALKEFMEKRGINPCQDVPVLSWQCWIAAAEGKSNANVCGLPHGKESK